MRLTTGSSWRRTVLAGALALLFLPVGAGAVCPNTVETGEQALWNQHNCWTAFRDWFRPYFNFQNNHWDGGWGWDSCDPTRAFPKMWNSAYLITYGIQDASLGPWHSNPDYYRWASGGVHGFRYEPEDDDSAFATASSGWFVTDRVEMQCPSFNSRNAGVRAGTVLHESTHIMFGGIFGGWSHQSNPPGSNCANNCSDDWFFHNVNSYPYGSLAGKRHSMVQIQIEFLCDLSEFGESWVPFGTALSAGNEANNRMTNRIRNPPGWTCGQPRPIYVPPPPPPPPGPGPCPSSTVCCGGEFGGVCTGWCEPCGSGCDPSLVCQVF